MRAAKAAGQRVTTEVCPHHLLLTDESCAGYDPNYKMNPPLRGKEDVAALLEGVRDGTIECLVTDHAPHSFQDKELGFQEAPFGIIGLETALGVALEVLVHSGRIPLERLIALFTSEPARIIGWKGEQARGALKPGYAGDVTIFHPEYPWTYDVKNSLSKGANTPFSGRTFRGGPIVTIVGGEIAWKAPGF